LSRDAVDAPTVAPGTAAAGAAPAARWRRRLAWAAVALLGGWALLRFGNDLAIVLESDSASRSVGTPAAGRLEHGKRLPSRGANFRVYSDLGALLGRNSVHDRVRASVVGAYARLAHIRPADRYVYGEAGWPGGGSFRPHRTHQNGLAVDFFVPVLDPAGRPAFFPASPLNRFGYGVEFDAQGRWQGWRIDFDALAAHLQTLAAVAEDEGLRIEVVIFDPTLLQRLQAGRARRGQLHGVRFSRTLPWIRHDEHYHVVFALRREARG
jgi:penicillin-insensitive murein DD-endopeptidase